MGQQVRNGFVFLGMAQFAGSAVPWQEP